jgi:hypothetical protein
VSILSFLRGKNQHGEDALRPLSTIPTSSPSTRSTSFTEAEKPVPLAIALSGVWMEEHPTNLKWLEGLELVRTERAAIKSKNWILFNLRQSIVQDNE